MNFNLFKYCKTILFLSALSCKVYSQPAIKFDTTKYDLGQIEQGQGFNIVKKIMFTNTGNEPLLIKDAHTGDGGSYASCPKEFVQPGQSSYLTFTYDSHRLGVFDRSISISTNIPNQTKYDYISIKGEVVYRKTQIKTDANTVLIPGDIDYNEIDTIRFYLTNIGKEKLYIYRNIYVLGPHDSHYISYPEEDVIMSKIKLKGEVNHREDTLPKSYSRQSFDTGANLEIDVLVQNVFGNTGEFERKIPFIYNSHDTLYLIVKGKYTGTPFKQKLYSRGRIYYYTNNKLEKTEDYNGDGSLNSVSYFEGSYCIRVETTNYSYYADQKNSVQIISFDHDKCIDVKEAPKN